MLDFKAKRTKFNFGCGSAPDPAGGAYSAPPDPLYSWIKGAYSNRRGGGRVGKVGRGREGKERRGEGGPQVTVEPGPLRALLRH